MKVIESIRKNTIIIIAITLLVLVLVLKDDFSSIVNALCNINLWYILIALVLFFLYIFLRAYVCYKTVDDKNFSLMESFKHNVIVQFFNGITPFSTGGQPMEIYMLTEHGINANKGTMYILQNFVFYQIALVLLGLGAVIYNAIYNLYPKVPILQQLVLIGFIINTLVAVVIVFVSFSEKFTKFCIRVMLFLLSKMHLVKDKEQAKKNWTERLEEFHKCAKVLRQRKSLFVSGILLNVISLACFYAIPLFIAYSMGDYSSMGLSAAITSSAYVFLMGSFVPIPGASGGIEYGFLSFFGNFFAASKASAILLIWRFITYYLPMIVGAVVFNVDERKKKI